jgi:hypothetical protein
MAKSYPSQPDNINYLNTLGFRFNIEFLPKTNWFTTAVNLPAIALGEVNHPTPFMQTQVPGNDLVFSPLSLTFLVDEDLENWRELYDWMTGIGFPVDYDQHKNQKNDKQIYSDATLTILNSNMMPNYLIIFKDLFPTDISDITFDSSSAEATPIKATASFRYLSYTYEKV